MVGQTHQTTRHYGTVTSQPPELLGRGVLSTAGDVYRWASKRAGRGQPSCWRLGVGCFCCFLCLALLLYSPFIPRTFVLPLRSMGFMLLFFFNIGVRA